VSGTTSICGSNWPLPLHAQSGTCLLHVVPPSLERVSAIHGVGQLPLHGFGTPYRVVTTYAQGAFGSVATAGSQSSALGSTTYSPAQPGAGEDCSAAVSTLKVPAALAAAAAASRWSVVAACSAASGFPPLPVSSALGSCVVALSVAGEADGGSVCRFASPTTRSSTSTATTAAIQRRFTGSLPGPGGTR
jgi:hypothetical protein